MALVYQVLGAPGADNALFVTVNGGQRSARLLFDCGADCVTQLGIAEIHAIDHLCFSHLHMDHVAGFDDFFRHTFARTGRTNTIWGPPETGAIVQHRMRGYRWNMTGLSSSWLVHDVTPDAVRAQRFELAEHFAHAHDAGAWPNVGPLFGSDDYQVTAVTLDHHTSVLAYIVREQARLNVDAARLTALGLRPGPWLAEIKDRRAQRETGPLVVDGATYDRAALRAELLVTTPGDSIAYLTDFGLDAASADALLPALRGCATLVCEAQYRHADLALAERHRHMTAVHAAQLAARAGAQRLVLFHLSERYTLAEWILMLAEARAVFAQTDLPDGWEAALTRRGSPP